MMQNLLQEEAYRNCRQFFCFVSLPGEPDTMELLRQALIDGKETAVPRCLPDDRAMVFHRLSPERDIREQLIPGSYGVLEPPGDLPVAVPTDAPETLCLIPGLAFDEAGGRLGYGAGYYDCFLACYPHMRKIGYAASQYITATVPTEPTDQRLDGIATERGIKWIRKT